MTLTYFVQKYTVLVNHSEQVIREYTTVDGAPKETIDLSSSSFNVYGQNFFFVLKVTTPSDINFYSQFDLDAQKVRQWDRNRVYIREERVSLRFSKCEKAYLDLFGLTASTNGGSNANENYFCLAQNQNLTFYGQYSDRENFWEGLQITLTDKCQANCDVNL